MLGLAKLGARYLKLTFVYENIFHWFGIYYVLYQTSNVLSNNKAPFSNVLVLTVLRINVAIVLIGLFVR